eukprot:1227462-Rhodomonas_salina.2
MRARYKPPTTLLARCMLGPVLSERPVLPGRRFDGLRSACQPRLQRHAATGSRAGQEHVATPDPMRLSCVGFMPRSAKGAPSTRVPTCWEMLTWGYAGTRMRAEVRVRGVRSLRHAVRCKGHQRRGQPHDLWAGGHM